MEKFKGINILVADDNAMNNQTLKQLLELSGASVSVAENGREAIETLRTSVVPIHVTLMDVNMPELDGLEATKIIRQDTQLSDMPIIAITADSSPQDQWRCFQAGMDSHIAKPLDYDKLCTSIEELINGKHNLFDLAPTLLDDKSEVEPKQEILRRFAQNTDLVRQMLSLYQQEFQKLFHELDHNEQRLKTRETLHAMRGLASTIGANRVVMSIIKLSELLKSHMLYKSMFQEAKRNLGIAQLSCIKRLNDMFDIEETSSIETSMCNLDTVDLSKTQKQKLIKLLKGSDLSAISEIEKLTDQYPKNGFLLRLRECVNHLKFDEALALLSSSSVNENKLSRADNAK